MGLDFYISDAANILHDEAFLFTPEARLKRWVNLGRRELARRTGCVIRLITGQSAFGASAQAGALIPGGAQPGALPGAADNASLNSFATTNTFQTITGVERYPYGFANPYLQDQYQGVSGIQDVISISASWGGSVRPSLDWLPWDVLQARARAFATLVTSYPYWWSTLDDGANGEVWLFPAPSFAMEMEWMTFAIPSDLNDDSDYDVIPEGFQSAIKYYVAGMAYLGKQRPMDAQIQFALFDQQIGSSRVSADRGKSPSYYPQMFMR